MIIPSIWRLNFVRIFRLIRNGHQLYERDYEMGDEVLKPFLVPTGLKAYMPEDEVLILANRSSNTFKRNLALPNGIGVIDADYYNNPNNEGEIFVQMINYGVRPLHIKKKAIGLLREFLSNISRLMTMTRLVAEESVVLVQQMKRKMINGTSKNTI